MHICFVILYVCEIEVYKPLKVDVSAEFEEDKKGTKNYACYSKGEGGGGGGGLSIMQTIERRKLRCFVHLELHDFVCKDLMKSREKKKPD